MPGERFVAVRRVHDAGKRLTACAGEARAYPTIGEAYKVIAIMQATFVTVAPRS